MEITQAKLCYFGGTVSFKRWCESNTEFRQGIALYCIALHCIALHCIALHKNKVMDKPVEELQIECPEANELLWLTSRV